MLTAITDRLHWQCYGGEEDEYCGEDCEAAIDETVYRWGALKSRMWAMIDLPPCHQCGAQCSLKADYTLKELGKMVQAVQNEQGIIWAYVLPLRYVRNIRLHWLLYERGKAEHAPVLPMPAPELLVHPQVAEIDSDVAYALWFGYLTMKYKKEQLGGITSNYNDPLFPVSVRNTTSPGAQLAQFSEE